MVPQPGEVRESIVRHSSWDEQRVVRGFVDSPPNRTLLRFAGDEHARGGRRALDVGCGAARNALPLARAGWDVIGLDTSLPMLAAAAARPEPVVGCVRFVQATMSELPFAARAFDFVIAHGVWNLATTDGMFRTAVAETARVLRPGGALFVFTFSRHTLRDDARPVAGQRYVYDQFSGSRQIFLTDAQLIDELQAAGFAPDAAVPLTEHNRTGRSMLAAAGPVIYEGAFRRVS